MSDPVDTAAIRAYFAEHLNAPTFEALCDEVDRLRAEVKHLRSVGAARSDTLEMRWQDTEDLSARLAAVLRVRDWMGANNDDAQYDLAIVALNGALGEDGTE